MINPTTRTNDEWKVYGLFHKTFAFIVFFAIPLMCFLTIIFHDDGKFHKRRIMIICIVNYILNGVRHGHMMLDFWKSNSHKESLASEIEVIVNSIVVMILFFDYSIDRKFESRQLQSTRDKNA